MKKKLLVIMVTYKRLEYTKRTLQSLLDSTPDADQCDIVVVDNDSDRDTVSTDMTDYLSEMFIKNKKLTVIFNPDNNGWGAANNLALKSVKWKDYEYILFSNNDVLYQTNWLEVTEELFSKYEKPQNSEAYFKEGLGILGLWKHTAHGVRQDLGDLVVKDDMPACAWVIKPEVVEIIGPFAEKGVCKTRGGNGEDSNYAQRAQEKGYLVAGPKYDLAEHLDKYDNSGGINPEYK